LNHIYPDYDFSLLRAHHFKKESGVEAVEEAIDGHLLEVSKVCIILHVSTWSFSMGCMVLKIQHLHLLSSIAANWARLNTTYLQLEHYSTAFAMHKCHNMLLSKLCKGHGIAIIHKLVTLDTIEECFTPAS